MSFSTIPIHPSLSGWKPWKAVASLLFIAGALTLFAERANGQVQPVQFTCSDKELEEGFQWATRQAMEYVRRNGDPVGDWYEAALPNRDAFCMRDVAHQLVGANVLGLASINRNLLTKFVQSLSASRDWCGYWEIDKLSRPAPVDYKSDQDFWYNLPASFDIIDASLRQYEWTGDTTYLTHPDFKKFYDITCHAYVDTWDSDHDGIMEGRPDGTPHYRGIGSYNEDEKGVTGNDLIAAQAMGYRDYAKILALQGKKSEGAPLLKKADALEQKFQAGWWDAANGYYRQFKRKDGTFARQDALQLWLLRWNFVPTNRTAQVLKSLDAYESQLNVEAFSHFALEYFRYGSSERAIQLLRKHVSADLKRREYPEVSYGALEAYVEGLMGITPIASRSTIITRSRCPETMTTSLDRLPVFDGSISVRHEGTHVTTFTNRTLSSLHWNACFYSSSTKVIVNGAVQAGTMFTDRNGSKYVSFLLTVQPGATATIASVQ